MSEEQLRQLQRQLWSIADALRGKMNADEFRDYILGFIFYKYLSEKMVAYANKILVSVESTDQCNTCVKTSYFDHFLVGNYGTHETVVYQAR